MQEIDRFDILMAAICFLLSFSDCFSMFMTVYTNDDMEFRCLDSYVGPEKLYLGYENIVLYRNKTPTEIPHLKFLEVVDHVLLDESDFYNKAFWNQEYVREKYRTCIDKNVTIFEHDESKNATKISYKIEKSSAYTCQKGFAWTKKPTAANNQQTIKYTFNLTNCDYSFYDKFSQTANLIGLLCGLLVGGFLADKLGRKWPHLISGVSLLVSLYLLTLAGDINTFILLQSWNGFLAAIAYNVRSVLFTELLSEKFRHLGSTLCCCGFALAYMLMPPIAYYLPFWKDQLYAYTLIFGSFTVFYLWIPESPQWLKQNHHYVAARNVENWICYFNGNKNYILDNNVEAVTLKFVQRQNSERSNKSLNVSENSNQKVKDPIVFSKLFTNKILANRLFWLAIFIWPGVTLIYLSFSYNQTYFEGSPYINVFITSFIEFSIYCFSGYLVKFGRRNILLICFVIGSGFSILGVFPSMLGDKIFQKIISYVNKTVVTLAFNIIYIYTAEIFPTNIRMMALCLCNVGSKLFCLLSPQFGMLVVSGEVGKVALYRGIEILVNLSCLVGCLFVPESIYNNRPDGMEDVKVQEVHRLVRF